MKELLPINTNILKWARVTIGLSIEEVASKMKKSSDAIKDWESGINTPTYPQLEKLAYQIYKRPVAVFFFPDVPEEETPKTEFRTLPDFVIEKLPSEIIKLYRKAKVFQLNLEELYDGERPVDSNILVQFYLKDSTDIKSIAYEIRKKLNITIEKQFSWESVKSAFKIWRKQLEELGIFIFKDSFHNNNFSGFCVYDNKYPVIYINNSMPISRQIFTIFHELGHLLLHLGGIDFRNKEIYDSFGKEYIEYEVLCNKFANEILVPIDALQSQELIVSENRIEHLANLFSVSREVILRNYLTLGKIDDKIYYKMAGKWIKDAKKIKEKSTGGHYYYTQKVYLGDTYINLAFSKYYQEKISIESLSEYLNIKVKNISSFEHYAFS